jgi:hypothetical protein
MSTQPRARRFPWIRYTIALVVILLIAFAPAIPMRIGEMIAEANGCRVEEAYAHPCIVNGEDWGVRVQGLVMYAWYLLLTVPVGLVLCGIWLIALIVHWLDYRRRTAAP